MKYLAICILASLLGVLLGFSAVTRSEASGFALAANVSTTAAGGHQVTLACTPGIGGGQVTGFNFLRSTIKGGPYTLLVPGTSATCNYVDTQTLVEGATYYYVAQASGPGGVSGNSNESSATVPFLPPATPSGLSSVSQ